MHNKCIFKVSLVRKMESIWKKIKIVLYVSICIKLRQVCTKLSSITTHVRNTSLMKINSNVIPFYNEFIQNSYLNHLFFLSKLFATFQRLQTDVFSFNFLGWLPDSKNHLKTIIQYYVFLMLQCIYIYRCVHTNLGIMFMYIEALYHRYSFIYTHILSLTVTNKQIYNFILTASLFQKCAPSGKRTCPPFLYTRQGMQNSQPKNI